MRYQMFYNERGERLWLPILAGAAIISAPLWLMVDSAMATIVIIINSLCTTNKPTLTLTHIRIQITSIHTK